MRGITKLLLERKFLLRFVTEPLRDRQQFLRNGAVYLNFYYIVSESKTLRKQREKLDKKK